MIDTYIKRDGQQITPGAYVCRVEDLDKLLDDKMKYEFHTLFYDNPGEMEQNPDAWRMFRDGITPPEFLLKFGIDFYKPRVRDAVAFDLVKLDDSSVSNTSDYTYMEHLTYSPLEYERMLLNRNYRVNLVNLEPEWSRITYTGESGVQSVKMKRSLERSYQGFRMSDTILGYFNSIFTEAFDCNDATPKLSTNFSKDVYLPYTQPFDVQSEVALISNTNRDILPTVARRYYDMKYGEYLELLKKNDILAISTFSCVDPKHDKTHTGKYLVKVQKWFPNGKYGYIVATIDRNGQFLKFQGGEPKIDIFSSEDNTILCVCEDDFKNDRKRPKIDEVWSPVEREVPMVHSTTSSQYSVFRQHIPDEDLDCVRNYNQFKERLVGMNYFLDEIDGYLKDKLNHRSECAIQEMMSIWRMFNEFERHRALLELVANYYDYLSEYDKLYTKRYQLKLMFDQKQQILDQMLEEYNAIGNTQLDRKLDLGHKIQSLKLELDKNIVKGIQALDVRLDAIRDAVDALNANVREIRDNETPLSNQEIQRIIKNLRVAFDKDDSQSAFNLAVQEFNEKVSQAKEELQSYFQDFDRGIHLVEKFGAETKDDDMFLMIRDFNGADEERGTGAGKDGKLGVLESIDISKFNRLVLETEKWRDFILYLDYEISTIHEMRLKCSDQTIRVKRLLHNFEERIADIEEQVWDDKHQLKDNFSFTAIAAAGIFDIILLHDWYACNASGKTYSDMGFKNQDEFMEFRKRCNKISYNLRKNQYLQMLEIDKSRLERMIRDMRDRVEGKDVLEYKDKYGWEAKKSELEPWSMADVTEKQAQRIRMFVKAEEYIKNKSQDERQYKKDCAEMHTRTVKYLKDVGIIKDEKDLEGLAVRNKATQYEGDICEEIRKVEAAKNTLDESIKNLTRQRDALRTILSRIQDAEKRAIQIRAENKLLFGACVKEKNRQKKNKMLLQKIENESKISDLERIVQESRDANFEDLSVLDSLRDEVDLNKKVYDSMLKNFKQNIGVDDDAISNLMVGIYNKYQGEILEHDDKTRKNK